MAPTCFSGCASQYRALPELFKGNRGCWRGIKKQIGEAAHAAPVAEPEPPSDGRASAVPQLSCPGLISRSQSAVSSDAHVSVSDVERPTLLRSAKALSPQGDHEKVGEKIGSLPVSPRDIDSSLAALTTATSEEVDAHEDAGSPTQNPWPTFGCCNAVGPSTAPRSPQWDSDWMWHASAQVGSGLWTGSKQAALFLGSQLHSAATLAQPHITSFAGAATDALQSAAAETMEGIRALGPRRPRASRASLTNGKRRGDLQPPLLVAPILPPLPELNAFAPEQPWSSIAGMAGMAPGPGLGYPGPASLPAPFAHAQSVAWPRSQSFATSTPWQGSAAQRLAPSMLGTSAQLQSAPASFHLSEDTNVWATNASWGTPGPGPRPGQAPAPVGPIVRQATVLRTTLGERRPLTESRIRPS